MCPYFAAAGKCALHQNSTACNADSDCYYLSLYGSSSLYGSRARDPEISNYRCRPADSVWSNVRDMLKMYHESEFRYEDGFCSKTYDSEESAYTRMTGANGMAATTRAVRRRSRNSRLRGHPHHVRAAAYRQTCETIETEALCGVADTADKCGGSRLIGRWPATPLNVCRPTNVVRAHATTPLCRASTTQRRADPERRVRRLLLRRAHVRVVPAG